MHKISNQPPVSSGVVLRSKTNKRPQTDSMAFLDNQNEVENLINSDTILNQLPKSNSKC